MAGLFSFSGSSGVDSGSDDMNCTGNFLIVTVQYLASAFVGSMAGFSASAAEVWMTRTWWQAGAKKISGTVTVDLFSLIGALLG
jgi:hypothetical protein